MGRLTEEAKKRMRMDFARGRAAVASGEMGAASGEGPPDTGVGRAVEVAWEPTEEEEEMEREWAAVGAQESSHMGGARERADESTRRQGGWEPTSEEEAMEDDSWEKTGGETVEPLARGAAWDAVGVG